MFVIRNAQGELLHKSAKPIIDPRATEEPDSVEQIKPGIVWVVKQGAQITDICDHYPLHPDAQPTTKADPELVAFWDATKPIAPRDPLVELDALKAQLVAKGVL